MDVNHVEASLAFPSFPRFCGQTFLERKDKELARPLREGVQRLDVRRVVRGLRTAGSSRCRSCSSGTPKLAAAEVRRNAARGGHAVCFTEIPPFLGLPSVHDDDGYWDPFFAACAETDTVVCMHIGSSSKMPSTSADAPPAVGSTLTYMNAAMSLTDCLMSGVLRALPDAQDRVLRGPDRLDPVRARARRQGVGGQPRRGAASPTRCKRPPSEYYYEHVYGCFFDDPHGLEVARRGRRRQHHVRDRLPAQRLDVAAHQEVAEGLMKDLDDEHDLQDLRGNAIRMLHLDLDE